MASIFTKEQLLQLTQTVYNLYKSNYINSQSLLYSVKPVENKVKIKNKALEIDMSPGTAENYSERLFNLFNELNEFNLHNGLQDCTKDLKRAGLKVFNKADFPEETIVTNESLIEDLEIRIKQSKKLTKEERHNEILKSSTLPKKIEVKTTGYIRSAHVILEVLDRAKGKCEGCDEDAPFKSKAKKTPYLEVHHIIQLANDGEDTVDNAIALCPNCHRESHYGEFSKKLIKKFLSIVNAVENNQK